MVALKEGRRPSLEVLQERLRQKLSAAWPEVKFSFEAGDIVSQVMNFGSATPVNVTVSGSDLAAVRSFTEKLAAQMRLLPSLRDVQIPQPLDFLGLPLQGLHGIKAQPGLDRPRKVIAIHALIAVAMLDLDRVLVGSPKGHFA